MIGIKEHRGEMKVRNVEMPNAPYSNRSCTITQYRITISILQHKKASKLKILRLFYVVKWI